ncbi:DUF2059 domain-containing protein [Roseovarius rhodophyticola]|uniref:DUF2059 domain-containing protein n=1 Tax=Roseovarius rhodophyticola TaxID=3080827 RepID=A0ABZ2TEA6_9RHOB|nr:DUF2059 domain-containing protein [Roseovarius sp. W115]MDV2928256.1 DUF2059 domain-containing protein [Roseovarius sp. W115]
MTRVLSLACATVFALLVTSPMARAAGEDMAALIDALRINETVEIMRKEGLRYGSELGVEMLPGVNAKAWQDQVARIYDTDKMAQVVTQGFETALDGKEIAEVVAFFTSETGQEIISLELSAREAFLNEDTEMAAMDAYERARDENSHLFQQVETLISDSDLVDYNVMGALNSNLMFYRGLADGGAFEMSEEDMLADVWSQEGDVRNDSEGWLGAFLILAYQPLDDAELEAYAEVYRSEQGKVLNAAIFEAYDQMYEELSYLLGRAVAQQMQSEEL